MLTKEVSKNKFTFFIAIGFLGIIAILVGFLKTFIIPIISGTKTWPIAIYEHAGLVFGWVLIFLIQSLLIQNVKHSHLISLWIT